MRQAMNSCVLVVEDQASCVDSDVSDLCQAERTLVLQPGRAAKVAAEVLRERAKVIIARVPRGFTELLKVIDLVRASGQETSIIAVSEEHDDRVEVALRMTGVTCYASDGPALDEALRQVNDDPVLRRAKATMPGDGLRRSSL